MKKRPACALVIDTSVLWDLFGIPSRDPDETEEQRLERRNKMKGSFECARQRGCYFFVPFPVLYEVANSIAHIKDAPLRQRLATAFVATAKDSLAKGAPWTVCPAGDGNISLLQKEHLLNLCDKFHHSSVNCMGLTDVAILHEAERLKSQFTADGRHVHIWTLDVALRKSQPDGEDATCPVV